MRLLVAAGESQSIYAASSDFRNFGSVDTVHDGREAVLTYINTSQAGRHYHAVFIGHTLQKISEIEVVNMLRYYDRQHRELAAGALICCVSIDNQWKMDHQIRFSDDTRTIFYNEPATTSELTGVLKITANKMGEFKPQATIRRHPFGGIYA